MFRFALSAVALAATLATAHPVFTDPLPVTAPDHAQAAAAAVAQPPSPAPTWSWSPDASPATGVGHGENAPVGLGWG
jgi:hypothetical protein